jgi:cobalt-zinc-cadmium efflux system outer membrane protein
MKLRYAVCLSMSTLVGCASTSAEPGFRDMAATVQTRTGHTLRWNRGAREDQKAAEAVHGLLLQPLTVDSAVQIALLRNPRLQATYEELSLVQADVVQAGLLSNPVFSASMTTAEREALDPNLVVGVTESFLDLLLIPAKKKIAASQFDEAKYRVGSQVLDLAAETKAAYVTVVAAQQVLAMRQAVADVEQASYELAQRQRAAGSTSELAVMGERGLVGQIEIELARSGGDLAAARERLTRLMGLWGADVAWRSVDRLPEVPLNEPPLEHLESRAIAERLDLAAIRQQLQTLAYAVNLAKTSRWTGLIDIGADVARLKDGSIVVGPRASIELPIFDQRQAVVARLEAQRRTSERLLEARAIEIRSDVREARDRLLLARAVIDRYRTEIIPTREQLVVLSQQQYGAMLLGVYALIQAKQSEVNAYREYIESVRDYWLSRGQLERAIGGTLPILDSGLAAPLQPPAPHDQPALPSVEHHHHT